jgi:hypothetical protein
VIEACKPLLVLCKEHVSKAVERLLDVAPLQSGNFEKLKTDASCECHAVLRSYCDSVLQICLICNYYSSQLSSLILLLNALKPLSQEVEGVRISHIVDQHNEVGFT